MVFVRVRESDIHKLEKEMDRIAIEFHILKNKCELLEAENKRLTENNIALTNRLCGKIIITEKDNY